MRDARLEVRERDMGGGRREEGGGKREREVGGGRDCLSKFVILNYIQSKHILVQYCETKKRGRGREERGCW